MKLNNWFKKIFFFKCFDVRYFLLFIIGLLCCVSCKQKIPEQKQAVILSQNDNISYQEAIEIEDTLPDDDDIISKEPIKNSRPIANSKRKNYPRSNVNSKPQKKEELLSTDIVRNYKTARPKKRVKDPNRPILRFDNLEYNFGYIDEGDIVNHDFYFTNVGRTPAIITEATTSCGCTVPSFPKYPIRPGQREKISVVFDSKGRLLKQNKSITITANTDPNYTTMYLTGEVWRTPKK